MPSSTSSGILEQLNKRNIHMVLFNLEREEEFNTTPSVFIRNKEIAILILSTKNLIYDQFKKAISTGWMREMQGRNIKCYFYSGDHDNENICGDQIEVKTSDKLEHTAEKLLAALDILVKRHPEIKLIYRTNLSSYIEADNFIRFINVKGLDEYSYAGLIGKTTYVREFFYRNRYLHKIFSIFPIGERINFASGSGFFIGRKNIEKLLKLPPLHLNLIDDVMIAKTLGIEPSKRLAPLRFDIKEGDLHKISASIYDCLLSEGILFHYRFKTTNRSKDAEMLKAFNEPRYRYASCTNS